MKRFSIRLLNRTLFHGSELKALFRACLKAHRVPPNCYTLEVLPGYHAAQSDGRPLNAAGRAALGKVRHSGPWDPERNGFAPQFHHGTKVWMAAPSASALDITTTRGFVLWCWILEHEVKHLCGWTEKELDEQHDPVVDKAINGGVPLVPSWARSFSPLVPKEKPRKDPFAARQLRIEHAEKMLARAELRAVRANAVLARWKRKLQALQRNRLAAESKLL